MWKQVGLDCFVVLMSNGPKIEELLPSYLGHDKGHGLSCPSARSAHVYTTKRLQEHLDSHFNKEENTQLEEKKL